MVFRQLQLGLAITALVGSACTSDDAGTSASITMDIDLRSCNADVESLTLTCPSTAVVVVHDQQRKLLAVDCATLPAGRLVNSAQVIQETLSLGTLPADVPITIGLSIHSGIVTPCPIDNVVSNAFLSGVTMLVTLANEFTPIPLLLECAGSPGLPGEPNTQACQQCDSDFDFCTASSGSASCAAAISDCQVQCTNMPDIDGCFTTCEFIQTYCVDAGMQILCSNDQNSCIDVCLSQVPGDACDTICSEASQKCSQYAFLGQQCSLQYQGCLGQCGDGSSCLSVGF